MTVDVWYCSPQKREDNRDFKTQNE
jgi:hypothetical protein